MISQTPRVSIITPSFNQGRFIRQTIESVLSQSYPDIEYWVIDGGSTDDTPDILASFGSRLNYLSEPDRGQTDAINKGLARATGQILGYLNSDDLLLPGAVQRVVDAFRDGKPLWVTGDYRIVDAGGHPIHSGVARYKRFLRRYSSQCIIHFTNYIVQPSTFWSRELMEQLGGFDPSLRYTMDYDFWLRAFRAAPPLVMDEPLSEFRIHGTSKGGSEYDRQFSEELQVLRRYTHNHLVVFLHMMHNALIKAVYRIIK